MNDAEVSWAELLSGKVADLPPVSRGLLLHLMEFQATHNLSHIEFAGAVGPVIEMLNVLLDEMKGQR